MKANNKAKAVPESDQKRTRYIPLPAAVVGLLNRNQVSEALGGISVRKLNMMISAGEFPKADAHLGRFPRWSVGLVNAWCLDRVGRPDGQGG